MINVGDVVLGEVTGILDYGFFVKINEQINGLVHISEISNGYVNNIMEYVKEGDKVVCEVMEVLDNGTKLRLAIKHNNYKLTDKYDDDAIFDMGFKPLKDKLPEWVNEKN